MRGTSDYQQVPGGGANDGLRHSNYETRNMRSVWHVNPKSFKGAHFATFPPELISPMVLAASPRGGLILDPFAGSGTTGVVALRHDRNFVGIELNREYCEMARDRLNNWHKDIKTPKPPDSRQTSLFGKER